MPKILKQFAVRFDDFPSQEDLKQETMEERMNEVFRRCVTPNNEIDEHFVDENIRTYLDESDYAGVIACALTVFYEKAEQQANAEEKQKQYEDAVTIDVMANMNGQLLYHDKNCSIYPKKVLLESHGNGCGCFREHVIKQTFKVINENAAEGKSLTISPNAGDFV